MLVVLIFSIRLRFSGFQYIVVAQPGKASLWEEAFEATKNSTGALVWRRGDTYEQFASTITDIKSQHQPTSSSASSSNSSSEDK